MKLRIRLLKTKRTDVTCVTCGRSRADRVIVRTDGTETDAGIHAECAEDVRTKLSETGT